MKKQSIRDKKGSRPRKAIESQTPSQSNRERIEVNITRVEPVPKTMAKINRAYTERVIIQRQETKEVYD